MTKREQILKDLSENGVIHARIAEKYNVSHAYISQLLKEQKMKEDVEKFKKIMKIINKGAIEAYEDKLTEEEREFWRDL